MIHPTERSSLRLHHIVALYVGSVLGCGVLILPGLSAEIAGPGSLLSWIFIIVLAFPMALTMGLLSARFPNDGGVSYFVTLAFNEQVGALVGWFFLVSGIIGVPILALTGAGYIAAAYGLSEFWRIVIAVSIILAGLFLNYIGMRISSQVQIAVVLGTICILVGAFIGSYRTVELSHFTPFIPNGWMSIGYAATLLFWSYIGWEAVTHIAEEFEDPKRDVVRGTIIASIIIGSLYLLTAYVVVGTHMYGPGISDVSLVHLIEGSFGQYGMILTGLTGLFVCLAPSISYISAASRLGYSLAVTGYAPSFLARLSERYYTHIGGLIFLAGCFSFIFIVYSTGLLSLAFLIQLPNSTFILTYIGGCAAGMVLLKDNRYAVFLSALSLILTSCILLFVSWAIFFPLGIILIWGIFLIRNRKRMGDLKRSL
ncbi:amino acid permease [Methanospirillum sp. J.3.6.1-F.2.7.3]|uniref:Amino acid permease n=1 Tax=Methanospirillum purgamenti TaxID=2834276 RepID=A0A8E7EIM1_9EURY|nr:MULTISPECIES: amino acid permease [Methanospirillum]MDX8551684.1 amino acid permease [Methanospirillum hungatei]QVV87676.1 amino acid permease [Methanospirillum sp. J.3.6.1-F.2.7.3]